MTHGKGSAGTAIWNPGWVEPRGERLQCLQQVTEMQVEVVLGTWRAALPTVFILEDRGAFSSERHEISRSRGHAFAPKPGQQLLPSSPLDRRLMPADIAPHRPSLVGSLYPIAELGCRPFTEAF